MKKVASIVLVFLLIFSVSITTFADVNTKQMINGLFVSTPFVEEAGEYLFEYSAFLKSINADFTYDKAAKTVTIAKDSQKLVLTAAKKTATVNGKKVNITVAPKLVGQAFYVPGKLICDTLKVAYGYNKTTNLITLSVPVKLLEAKDIAKYAEAVVKINVYNQKRQLLGTGSGFIVSTDGKIVTNYHVIQGAYSAEAIASDDTVYPIAGVVNFSKDKDIAVLKISNKTPLPIVPLGDSSKVELGENVVAIGSPLGLQNTVSTGIVSSIRPNLYRKATNVTDIQISAPISPGSSGGVLFNMYGEAIGVTTAGLNASGGENLNFAIPINEVKAYLNPQSITDLPTVAAQDGSDLKLQIALLDSYKRFIDIGSSIDNLMWTLLYRTSMAMAINDYTFLGEYVDDLNAFIDYKNKEVDDIVFVMETAEDVGLNVADMDEVLGFYYDAIEEMKLTVDYLDAYSKDKSEISLKAFVDSAKKVSGLNIEARKISEKGYSSMLEKLK